VFPRLPPELREQLQRAGFRTAHGGSRSKSRIGSTKPVRQEWAISSLRSYSPAGIEVPCLTGNAVDFLDLPAELDPRSAVNVRIGEPFLEEDQYRGTTADYAWCLYENGDCESIAAR
jgi:hypothetical protein